MFQRLVNLPKNNSFFLFGARGTGKSTWLQYIFPPQSTLYIDFLSYKTETEYSRNPDLLEQRCKELPRDISHVIIDEVQKVPKILDIVHRIIENKDIQVHFILTGSSARKLKAGSANLLAGRAFVRYLFPFTFLELQKYFNLEQVLSWGSLPKLYAFNSTSEKQDFLESYTQIYLKEEVWGEQIIRKIEPFRKFLEVAAACNGKIINATNIARDVGVSPKTVQEYYSILEDTLLGFTLETFHTSVRKRLKNSPKFFFFDLGVARTLANMHTVPIVESTSYFGELFETFLINEIYKFNVYNKKSYKLSYLLTSNNIELDLILERPGKPLAIIEIKSTISIKEQHIKSLKLFANDFPEAEFFCFSRDPIPKRIDKIRILPWQQFVDVI